MEGAPVGRVAVFASTARLQAGSKLERDILFGAGIGAVVAFGAALVFVSFYIGPLVRVTEGASRRLEKNGQEGPIAVLGLSAAAAARYWIDRKIRGESGPPKTIDVADLLQRVITRLEGSVRAWGRMLFIRAEPKWHRHRAAASPHAKRP